MIKRVKPNGDNIVYHLPEGWPLWYRTPRDCELAVTLVSAPAQALTVKVRTRTGEVREVKAARVRCRQSWGLPGNPMIPAVWPECD